MERFRNKAIVVTGAGRGLGRALARTFAREGARVALIGRTPASLDRTVGECPADSAFAFPADLGDADQCRAAFAGITERFGKLDALINNAAVYDFFRIDEATPELMRNAVDTNLLGPMLCAHFAIPLLREAGGGDIINISSESVASPYTFLAAYAATKAGLETLSVGLRRELAPDKIRVVTLRVGAMIDPDREGMPADMATMQRFIEQNPAVVMSADHGAMPLDTVATAVINLLTLPRDASFEHVELRPV